MEREGCLTTHSTEDERLIKQPGDTKAAAKNLFYQRDNELRPVPHCKSRASRDMTRLGHAKNANVRYQYPSSIRWGVILQFRALAILLLFSTEVHAGDGVRSVTNSKLRLAQSSAACDQIQKAYSQCKMRLRDIGGGDSGQAGAFRQCMDAYYKAGVAAGCPPN